MSDTQTQYFVPPDDLTRSLAAANPDQQGNQ